ncbi:HIRAN domain-containing protein [Pseudomonas sp. 148P]|uniref:HIRAN domain-containing protein n=1 Tax=Pseudomonas ulcerans TaxID=3115852 RepID=A0ABU7HWB5_9PSED|nr:MULTISPECIES: HIRAN domain-containing protein [unclassified Pseudomonas]MEE1922883.1 HIRAN domain-containing protein [Pseudomonas sp. 147P]MEE1935733.1 HIRAN domain-containing protein [Pseudomonas sp. 148P]
MEAAKRRISLTKKQLQTEAGMELLSICESVTADGMIADEEIHAINLWLIRNPDTDFPAAHFLKEILSKSPSDQSATEEERAEIAKAIETVLPPTQRQLAVAARKNAAAEERLVTKRSAADAKKAAQDLKKRQRPLATADFMVAGTRHEGRGEIIDLFIRTGSRVTLRRDPGNKHSRFAIVVETTGGESIGHVPEEYAQTLAPLMDEGAVASASVKKILESNSGPIPVVLAQLLDPLALNPPADATLETAPPTKARSTRWPTLVIALIILFVVFRALTNN